MCLWVGFSISSLGSTLTGFALGVYIFQKTGSASLFALMAFCLRIPNVFVPLIAGAMGDQMNRRTLIILSNLAPCLINLLLLILIQYDIFKIWLIFLVVTLSEIFYLFQIPSFRASIPLVVKPADLGRANSMLQISSSAEQIMAPTLAGFLLGIMHLKGIILIDAMTFVVFILILLTLSSTSLNIQKRSINQHSFFDQIKAGWQYIRKHQEILNIFIYLAVIHFFLSASTVLIVPMVLSFGSEKILGILMGIFGAGSITGSLLMSSGKLIAIKEENILWASLASGLFLMLAGFSTSVMYLIVIFFALSLSLAVITISITTRFQQRVSPEYQSRIFGNMGLVVGGLAAVTALITGPAADYLFNPMLQETGCLADSIGKLIGTGPGRGIGLMFVLFGVALLVINTFLIRRFFAHAKQQHQASRPLGEGNEMPTTG